MRLILSLGLALLVACSQSRGVFKLGPDTYITSAAASPSAGASEAQRLALSEANEYCANIGKTVMVMKSRDVIAVYGGGSSKVTFRSFAKDPGQQRKASAKTVDATCEDRRKRGATRVSAPCWVKANVGLDC